MTQPESKPTPPSVHTTETAPADFAGEGRSNDRRAAFDRRMFPRPEGRRVLGGRRDGDPHDD